MSLRAQGGSNELVAVGLLDVELEQCGGVAVEHQQRSSMTMRETGVP